MVAALALVGYFLSRTIGLPQMGDDIGNWGEPLGILAIISEAIMLITAAVQLGRLHHESSASRVPTHAQDAFSRSSP
ncbi:MAG: hypothetical protein ABIZ07_13465, partial [Dermatophilaceae bacterium]